MKIEFVSALFLDSRNVSGACLAAILVVELRVSDTVAAEEVAVDEVADSAWDVVVCEAV